MVRQQFQPPFGGAPQSPPPPFVPQQQQAYGQYPGQYPGQFPGQYPYHPHRWSMCFNRNTYVWLNNGRSFWMYPVGADRSFVYGYRWNGYTWIYRPINRNRIVNFNCFF